MGGFLLNLAYESPVVMATQYRGRRLMPCDSFESKRDAVDAERMLVANDGLAAAIVARRAIGSSAPYRASPEVAASAPR
jgi:hypothetical protein